MKLWREIFICWPKVASWETKIVTININKLKLLRFVFESSLKDEIFNSYYGPIKKQLFINEEVTQLGNITSRLSENNICISNYSRPQHACLLLLPCPKPKRRRRQLQNQKLTIRKPKNRLTRSKTRGEFMNLETGRQEGESQEDMITDIIITMWKRH